MRRADRVPSASPGAPLASPPRELRLRPGFAALYQDQAIEPGIWLPAPENAALAAGRAHQAGELSIHRRTFDPRHFSFRGGEGPRPPTWTEVRTRMEDPA